jgi:CheY-like chemotaxis protein
MNTAAVQTLAPDDASAYAAPALVGLMTLPGAGQGELVWILSPHNAEHQYLRPLMERAGYSVESISSGVQALAQAGSQVPDLLLLDGQLHDVDSLAMVKHWRALAAATHCPVIFLADSAQPPSAMPAASTPQARAAQPYPKRPISGEPLSGHPFRAAPPGWSRP